MAALADIVVEKVVTGSAFQDFAQGRRIVIDKACLTADLPNLESKLLAALERVGAKTAHMDIECQPMKLPGPWHVDCNQDHATIEFRMWNEGDALTVRWNFLSGVLCGLGEYFTATWNGTRWVASDVGTVTV